MSDGQLDLLLAVGISVALTLLLRWGESAVRKRLGPTRLFMTLASGQILEQTCDEKIQAVRLEYEQKIREINERWMKREAEMQTQIDFLLDALVERPVRHVVPPPVTAVRTAPSPAKVLGIWPVSDLETRREIDAIAKSGILYVPVKGGATKRSVLEALSRDKPNILHVGAHANKNGIELDDGKAMIGWWRVVAGRSPFLRLIVLNACSTLSIVDALKDVGIPAVVGMRGDIGDAVSIEFVEDFYNRLMRGESVGEAAAVAALSLTNLTDQEMIVARDPDGWTIAKG